VLMTARSLEQLLLQRLGTWEACSDPDEPWVPPLGAAAQTLPATAQAWICQLSVEVERTQHADGVGEESAQVEGLPGQVRLLAEPPSSEPSWTKQCRIEPTTPEHESTKQVPTEPASSESRWTAPAVDVAQPAPRADTSSPDVLVLRSAIDALAAQDPGELPGPVALQRARDLMRESERLRALSIEALGDVDTRQLFTFADAPSTSAWVKAQQVPGVDGSEVTLARRLSKARRIAEELKAGRMSAATAARLTRWLLKSRPHLDRADGLIDGLDAEAVLQGVCVRGVRALLAEQGAPADDPELVQVRAELESIVSGGGSQLDRLEAALVVFAHRCDPVLLPSGLALLMDALLPVEHEKRAERAEQDRGLTLHRDVERGGGTVGGRVDDELFELLSTAIAAAGATDPGNPDDTVAWRDGRVATAGDDTLAPDDWPADAPRPRSTKQRRHDALKRGLRALLDSGVLGSRGKAAPHIVVTVPIEYAAGLPGALPGRTASGGRLTREQVRDLLCRGQFTRMVLDAKNRVVEVSHTQRTATALERLMLHVQTGGVCQRRGCAHGPGSGHVLVPHHVELFSQTGTTAFDDTVWICELDHDHHLHGQGRNLTLKDGRVIGPSGWVRR
jgi:hypothetical protein